MFVSICTSVDGGHYQGTFALAHARVADCINIYFAPCWPIITINIILYSILCGNIKVKDLPGTIAASSAGAVCQQTILR